MGGSSRTARTPVKAHGTGKGLGRHFEGWQPGLLAVLFAAVSAVLAVPQSVTPEIPEPMLAPRALEKVAHEDAQLAKEAERAQLHLDVREVGSAVRAYGLADASGDERALGVERREVAKAVERARPHGEHALVLLRAFQLRSFQRELLRWEATGEVSDELRELSGRFVETAQHDGWVDQRQPGRHLILDETVRAALFKKRWAEITLSRGPAFELTREENVAVLRFLILHPPHEARANLSPVEQERAQRARDTYRLSKIKELYAIDPSYPAELARGTIFYRRHEYPHAVESFRTYLDAHPEGGPYAARANNYLRAALGADSGER